jgi:hypothetical protein
MTFITFVLVTVVHGIKIQDFKEAENSRIKINQPHTTPKGN